MNLLEHYVLNVNSVEDITIEAKRKIGFMPSEKIYKVDMDTVCYGVKERVVKVFTEKEYMSMKKNGYYMA